MEKQKSNHVVPLDELNFLAAKFLLTIPAHLRDNWGRVGFQLEKGKIEENETPRACAAREAYEEIGFNVKTILDPRTWFEKVEIILFQI